MLLKLRADFCQLCATYAHHFLGFILHNLNNFGNVNKETVKLMHRVKTSIHSAKLSTAACAVGSVCRERRMDTSIVPGKAGTCPPKCPFLLSDPGQYLIYGFLGPHKSTSKMAYP